MNDTITFDNDSLDFILKCFDIKEHPDTGVLFRYGEPVPTLDGKPIKKKDIAGIVNTEEGLKVIRNNIVDLIEAMDRKLI